MKTLKPILAALAMTIAVTAGAQTLKMEPQVADVTTYEASTAVNLVVVKPEIQKSTSIHQSWPSEQTGDKMKC